MINEKKGLFNLVDESIERDLRGHEEQNPRFKAYLKKDEYGNYSLVDSDSSANSCSIKCVFSEGGLKEFFLDAPAYISFDSINNSQILLKKYRFDYLTVEVSEESLAYRVVCFIGEFEVDGTKKIQIDTIPKNVNFDKVISAKVEKVANNLCKKLYEESSSQVLKPAIFDARNFICKDFSIQTSRPSFVSFFSTIKKSRNIEGNNFLLKTGESLPDAWPYLQDVEIDYTIIEKVKNFDYKLSFSKNPTQIQKKQEEQFQASKSNLDPLEKPITEDRESGFIPTNLVLDIEASAENIEKYLLRKVKRHRPIKNGEKLPSNIQELVKKFGDVCANVTHDMMKKYQFYHNFYSFS